jgi:DNA-directed RNA polymerase specialized sigma24 family protein
MDEKQFQEISSRLDTIIKLLALTSVEGKDPKKQVLVLSSFGFQPKQIANILKEKPSTIRTRLSRARKDSKEPQSNSENQVTEGQAKNE